MSLASTGTPTHTPMQTHTHWYTYTHPQFKIINKELKCLNQFPRWLGCGSEDREHSRFPLLHVSVPTIHSSWLPAGHDLWGLGRAPFLQSAEHGPTHPPSWSHHHCKKQIKEITKPPQIILGALSTKQLLCFVPSACSSYDRNTENVSELGHNEGAQAKMEAFCKAQRRGRGHGICARETELPKSGWQTRTISSLVSHGILLKKYSHCFYITYEANENKSHSVWPKSASQLVKEAKHLKIPLMYFTLLVYVQAS